MKTQDQEVLSLSYDTLADVFNYHLSHTPTKIVYRFLKNGEEELGSRTYQELYNRAHCIATHILSRVNPGDRVVLLYPSGLDFIDAFFGCILAGVVAVPSVVPGSKRHIGRLAHTILDSGSTLFLTTERIYQKSKDWFSGSSGGNIPWLSTDTLDRVIDDVFFPEITKDTLVFLQYTSGSTGTPKGVMVDHSNMIHNSRLIQRCFNHTRRSVGVGWLPIYHDMGLIGNVLQPFYVGFEVILMPPTAFVQKPLRWLRAISRYKATSSGGPNFAYDLCVNKIPKEELSDLDLSSWQVAFNGAEPIHCSTLDRFSDYFTRCGFRDTSFLPCYGMAETTLIVSGVLHHSVPNRLSVCTTAFEQGFIKPEAVPAVRSSTKKLISNGAVLDGLSVKIVNPTTLVVCQDDEIGELWVMGPSVAKGYWNNSKATEASFGAYIHAQDGQKEGPYLRTGDLGFLYQGEVYVSGRLKELLIINGANHYPQDIEHTVQLSDRALQPHGGGAFTIEDKGSPKLVVVQEVKRSHLKELNSSKVITAIQQAVMMNHQLALHSIILVSPGRVPKTSSGKIRRLALQKFYIAKELKGVLLDWSKATLPSEKNPSLVSDSQDAVMLSPTRAWLQIALSQVLQVDFSELTAQSSFASLGMDSLTAINLSGKINTQFGIDCDATVLFEYATIEAVAGYIDTAIQAKDAPARNNTISSLQSYSNPQEHYPVSYTQEALWLTDQLEGSFGYHIFRVLHSKTTPNVALLQKAMDTLLDRHPVLRTVIKEKEGLLSQKIIPDTLFTVDTVTVSNADDLNECLYQHIYRPFDLSGDILIRITVSNTPKRYYLAFVFHHIACDGLSEATLLNEFMSIYTGLSQGNPVVFSPLPLQYSDYALWQRSDEQQQQIAASLPFWKNHLDGVSPLQLPYDLVRSDDSLYTGGEYRFEIKDNLTDQLLDFSKSYEATVFMVMLSAFKVLMYRYSGQQDICVGVPSANRTDPALKDMVGMFVNTLPIRTVMDPDQNTLDLVAKIKSATLAGYKHQHVPFKEMVSAVLPERQQGINPIFQVSFGAHNTPEVEISLDRESWRPYPLPPQYALFDVSCTVDQQKDGISITIHYRSDRFSKAMIQRMAGHYQELLQVMVARPKLSIGDLSILTPKEEHQLLVEWNDTTVDYPKDQCIHELFEEQAGKTPDAIAVVFEDQQLTYQELNEKSNQLAHYLQQQGVQPEVLVGICVERSLEMMIGLLGILKAGGAYVPIDPAYPQERIVYMLEDSAVPVLLTQQRLVDHLPVNQVQVVCLDTDWVKIAQASQEQGSSEVQPHNLAYMIYTSGSTGKPKGVMIEHHSVISLVKENKYLNLNEEKLFLQLAPISFDASTFEIWGCFLNGAKLIIYPDQVISFKELGQIIKKYSITTLWLTARLFHAMIDDYIEDLDSLTELLAGGDVLSSSHVKKTFHRLKGCQLINGYGPTENTTFTCYHLITNSSVLGGSIPIGKPIANTQIYILDQNNKPVPIGITGELYIGGAGLARGYHNRPELTAQKFIVNPFNQDKDNRLYKTGDLARYLPDGNIEFLGRMDHQVKIRGFRIELGEIENVLLQHPEVHEAIVIAREDNPGDKRLVAYIITQDKDIDSAFLREYLKNKLPDYMVPGAFVMLDAMPLTPNGKINRKALPAPDASSLITQDHVAPSNATEEALVKIWQEVLGIDKVGIHDNFFELGGHSLLATRVVSQIDKTLSTTLALKTLFELPTIAGLSLFIATNQQILKEVIVPSIEPVSRDQDMLLSFAQERLWFLDQLEGFNATYNMFGAVELMGHLDSDILQQAVTEIVSRHEALRTNFIGTQGVPVQVISSESAVEIAINDVHTLSKSAQETAVKKLMTIEAEKPFDLAMDSLVRLTLIKLEDKVHIVLVTMHHIISDGWSLGVFIKELTLLYKAYSQGLASPLPALPIQYADVAHWQRRYFTEKALASHLSYWKEQLEKTPPLLELPTDHPRPSVQSFRGQAEYFKLDKTLTMELKKLSQQSGATLFMTLLASFSTLLYRLSGQSDIVVGSPIANRNHSELENLIGFFVNTLVLRTQITENPDFLNLLAQVKQSCLDGYTHQDVPFEQLVEALNPERNLSHTPLFQVMFVLQNTPVEKLEIPGLGVTPLPTQSTAAKFDLTLSMEETPEGLKGYWEYNTDLFDQTTIRRWIGHFKTLLDGIVRHPEMSVDRLPLLTSKEEHQLLVEWNDTTVDYPKDQYIHELFEEQAGKTPDAIAVVFEDQQLTYQELNEKSNQLAHYLQQQGVQPEVLVGICVERSLEMMIGLLGILKAGGAYVPIDPAYPQERIVYMLEDSAATVLLTQQRLVDHLPVNQAQVVCLDSDWSTIVQASQGHCSSGVQSHNLAYMIYTSGSTGKPKGVLMTHKGLLNLIFWHLRTFLVTSADRATQLAGIAFDASVWELWPYLAVGASIHLVKPTVITSPENLRNWLLAQKISISFLPTPLAENLLALEWPESIVLRFILTGGDKLHYHSSASLPFELVNNYGPTENTVVTTSNVVARVDKNSQPSIGHPISNTQVYILDHHLKPVPIGVAGELHIGGAGLARGYHNRPKLTEERFISNAFDQDPDSRLYKTGDLARYLPDGNIEFLGRMDHQVKIRGFRIELGEIENVLLQHPEVHEAVVIAREDNAGDKRLVAYLIAQNKEMDSVLLREYLKNKLPHYMVPGAFVMLDAMPLTPNGKINRKALPAPDASALITQDYVAPRNATEEALVAIWQEVLGIKKVGIHDNFFELGGHSMLTIKVIAQINTCFSKHFGVALLFECPTIEALAHRIKRKGMDSSILVCLEQGSHDSMRPIFCTPPVSGMVNQLYPLSKVLGKQQPLYGFQCPGLDGLTPVIKTIPEQAAIFIKAMQQIDPIGPYRIAGYSYGGRVALEMVLQLQDMGHCVEELILFDSIAPQKAEIDVTQIELQQVLALINSFFGKQVIIIDTKEMMSMSLNTGYDLLYQQLLSTDIGLTELQLKGFIAVLENNFRLHTTYYPNLKEKLTIPLTLFKAKNNNYNEKGVIAINGNKNTYGWDRFVNDIKVHTIQGDHHTMLTFPYIKEISKYLSRAIEG